MFTKQNSIGISNNLKNELTDKFHAAITAINPLDAETTLVNQYTASSYFSDSLIDLENLSNFNSLSLLEPDNFYGNHTQFATDFNLSFDFNANIEDVNNRLKISDRNTDKLIDFDVSSIIQELISPDFVINSNTVNASYSQPSDTSATEATYTAQSSTFDTSYGYGLVDAADAVATAIGLERFADVANASNTYDWGLDAISVPEVWSQGYTGENVVVAVIDSGVDFTHSDLNDNIWINYGEVFGDGIDNDANGYVDDAIGWDFVSNENNPIDEQFHGTHVAGIIAAEADGNGITGVAYNAKIMPIRVLDANGSGSNENIARGIIYAADNGANVINLSLTGDYSTDIETAVKYATERGAIVVMAAGNKSLEQPEYPATLATNWGIAVGAMNSDYYVADFSNRAGSDSRLHYVIAPGQDIYSTTPGDNYKFENGTSMAAPYVSGVAALMLSANPYLTPEQIRQIITSTAIA
jgi:subtilisin family serine protease